MIFLVSYYLKLLYDIGKSVPHITQNSDLFSYCKESKIHF